MKEAYKTPEIDIVKYAPEQTITMSMIDGFDIDSSLLD